MKSRIPVAVEHAAELIRTANAAKLAFENAVAAAAGLDCTINNAGQLAVSEWLSQVWVHDCDDNDRDRHIHHYCKLAEKKELERIATDGDAKIVLVVSALSTKSGRPARLELPSRAFDWWASTPAEKA
jgi:hypothetical protein